jgi:hypothetical protein
VPWPGWVLWKEVFRRQPPSIGSRDELPDTQPTETGELWKFGSDLRHRTASIHQLCRWSRRSNRSLGRQRRRRGESHRRGRGRSHRMGPARLGDALPRSGDPYRSLGVARRRELESYPSAPIRGSGYEVFDRRRLDRPATGERLQEQSASSRAARHRSCIAKRLASSGRRPKTSFARSASAAAGECIL